MKLKEVSYIIPKNKDSMFYFLQSFADLCKNGINYDMQKTEEGFRASFNIDGNSVTLRETSHGINLESFSQSSLDLASKLIGLKK